MRNKKIIVAVFSTLFFSSCQKPEESEMWTQLNVNSTNYVTGEPIEDVFVSVIQKKNKSLFDTEILTLEEGYTINGEFNYGWKSKSRNKISYEYLAQADPSKYYIIDFDQFGYIQKGELNIIDFQLVPMTDVYWHIENINCFDSTDSMWFKIDHQSLKYQSEDWSPVGIAGCYYFSEKNDEPMPIGTYDISTKTKRVTGTTYETIQVTLFEGQTDTIHMLY